MAITIHYVNKEWDLVSRLLDIPALHSRHSAIYLLEVLNSTLERYRLEDKVLS